MKGDDKKWRQQSGHVNVVQTETFLSKFVSVF